MNIKMTMKILSKKFYKQKSNKNKLIKSFQ